MYGYEKFIECLNNINVLTNKLSTPLIILVWFIMLYTIFQTIFGSVSSIIHGNTCQIQSESPHPSNSISITRSAMDGFFYAIVSHTLLSYKFDIIKMCARLLKNDVIEYFYFCVLCYYDLFLDGVKIKYVDENKYYTKITSSVNILSVTYLALLADDKSNKLINFVIFLITLILNVLNFTKTQNNYNNLNLGDVKITKDRHGYVVCKDNPTSSLESLVKIDWFDGEK